MKQEGEWISTKDKLPKTEGWYLVRFNVDKANTKTAMHFRPKKEQWFVDANAVHDWKGLQPKYWFNLDT